MGVALKRLDHQRQRFDLCDEGQHFSSCTRWPLIIGVSVEKVSDVCRLSELGLFPEHRWRVWAKVFRRRPQTEYTLWRNEKRCYTRILPMLATEPMYEAGHYRSIEGMFQSSNSPLRFGHRFGDDEPN